MSRYLSNSLSFIYQLLADILIRVILLNLEGLSFFKIICSIGHHTIMYDFSGILYSIGASFEALIMGS